MVAMTSRLSITVFLVTLFSATASLAQIRPVEGEPVRATDGTVLGQVQQVVNDRAGRPTQVLVQPKGVRTPALHSLAIKSLTESPEGLTAPITKAEFDAMPTVDLDN
ncbi:MAG: hypothetical protein CGW95_09545 [Phenylobacterium zucineum]|nr:MAG: hypothetical protein CGW95_09545 [Phenylobacterium zucineum]